MCNKFAKYLSPLGKKYHEIKITQKHLIVKIKEKKRLY